ncbi:hypothetical protein MKR64_01300 [Acinetobacter baumannii]
MKSECAEDFDYSGIVKRDTMIFDSIIGGDKLSYSEYKKKIILDHNYSDIWSMVYFSLVKGEEQKQDSLIDVLSKNLNTFLTATRNKNKTYNDLIKVSVEF